MRGIVRSIGAALVLLMVASACGDDADVADGDESLAELHALAIVRIITVDNGFGGGDPFDVIQIADIVGGEGGGTLAPAAVASITEELADLGEVEFVADPQALIQDHFDQNTTGVAVVTIGPVRVDGDRAEVELSLWCGSLCAVGLTYAAFLGPSGWEIEGTTGPIVMS